MERTHWGAGTEPQGFPGTGAASPIESSSWTGTSPLRAAGLFTAANTSPEVVTRNINTISELLAGAHIL